MKKDRCRHKKDGECEPETSRQTDKHTRLMTFHNLHGKLHHSHYRLPSRLMMAAYIILKLPGRRQKETRRGEGDNGEKRETEMHGGGKLFR